jgi:exopolysaccharide biosynthesis polyprenyl glycosylphosphotransferase
VGAVQGIRGQGTAAVSRADVLATPVEAPTVADGRSRSERISAAQVGLVAADVAALVVAGAVSGLDLGLIALFGTALVLCRTSAQLYRRRLRLSALDDLPRSLMTLALASGPVALVPGLLHLADPAHSRTRLLLTFVVVDEALRVLVFAGARWGRRRHHRLDRTLVMGAGNVGTALATTMLEFPELGLLPVGFVDPDPHVDDEHELVVPVLSSHPEDLEQVIREHRIGTVVVSFALARESELVDTAIAADLMGRTVLVVPRLFELHHDGPDVERLRGYPLVRLHHDPTRRLSWLIKRGTDVLLGTVLLLLCLPVLAACALAVLVESGRPILFGQERISLDGKRFRILKLRSLTPDSDAESQTTWSVATDDRVGRVGRFLRRTSLDELPQLWNIVRGDMSFVGPRPERPGFVRQFSEEHERYWARHRVPAGLTGLAQVNGLRGDTSISERARYDNYYIANWSVWLDLQILLLTAREVFRGSGR